MPIYEYLNTETGKIEERWLPVERRDDVPEHLKRVEVPRRLGFVAGLTDPIDSDVSVPKAFRQLEDSVDYREIEKQSGFSKDEIRRVWEFAVILALMLSMFSTRAADLSAGYSFSVNDSVTAAKLNALVGSASINTSFLTDKTAATPSAADTFLFYSSASAAWRKVRFDTMMQTNTSLITLQTEDTAPATGDYLLTYDVSAGALKKVTFGSVATNNLIVTPGLSNALQLVITNLPVQTAPTNGDTFVMFDRTNNVVKQVTQARLLTNIVGNLPSFDFVTNGIVVTNAMLFSAAHGLGKVPRNVRCVLVATNSGAEGGYSVGDEIDLNGVTLNGAINIPWATYGANATSVFLAAGGGVTNNAQVPQLRSNLLVNALAILNKTNGLFVATNWNLKIYATP